MDFMEMLASGMKNRNEEFSSQKEAVKNLTEFLACKPEFAIGDHVERNKYGRNKHNTPIDNQAAFVYRKLDSFEVAPDGGNGADMIIAVAIQKDTFGFYKVYSGNFQKVVEKKNIFSIKRK